MVGTTWYRRGPRYWLRRVVVSGFSLLVMTLVFVALLVAFHDLVSGMPSGWRTGCEVAYGAVCAAAGVWGWVRGRRQLAAALAAPATTAEETWHRRCSSRR
ncbi:hypothetical protein HY68_01950 [Streptomyces sp. AcH 505]|uniref:hypothetical protein n=1 Tax=Streptomyces sp. AcH 505 TaxID=352211 RepID=UPI000591B740|nr:hypothetical protein HY68_01950 [Streptomyces sp. AcH 505]